VSANVEEKKNEVGNNPDEMKDAASHPNYCAICREISTSPSRTNCMHVFCFECIGQWTVRRDRDGASCPTCRTRITHITNDDETLPVGVAVAVRMERIAAARARMAAERAAARVSPAASAAAALGRVRLDAEPAAEPAVAGAVEADMDAYLGDFEAEEPPAPPELLLDTHRDPATTAIYEALLQSIDTVIADAENIDIRGRESFGEHHVPAQDIVDIADYDNYEAKLNLLISSARRRLHRIVQEGYRAREETQAIAGGIYTLRALRPQRDQRQALEDELATIRSREEEIQSRLPRPSAGRRRGSSNASSRPRQRRRLL